MKPIEVNENFDTEVKGLSQANQGQGKKVNKMARYKLQRDPYENENLNKKGAEDNQDQIIYKADDQLMKDDLNLKFKTQIVNLLKLLLDKTT